MTHGSLFSGIGGFDLAAEWMGWENKFHCEINTFGQKILKHYWPDAISYTDITKTDFSIHRGEINIISGGFPCQPYSTSGQRKGKEDDRHLWPEMLRSVREVRPRWVVGENVPGIINWSRGLVVNEIKIDLENEGFTLLPPVIIPACATNTSHRRDRIWFIAYSNEGRLQKSNSEFRQINRIPKEASIKFTRNSFTQWNTRKRSTGMLFRGNGVSSKLDGITFSEWRKQTIMAAGNAIVPQVAYEIFKAIEQYEELTRG